MKGIHAWEKTLASIWVTETIQVTGTIISHALCKAQQTLTIESRSMGPPSFDLVYWVGNGVVTLSVWNFCLAEPMTRSTCILTLASLCVDSTTAGGNWDFPFVKLEYWELHLCVSHCPPHWTHDQPVQHHLLEVIKISTVFSNEFMMLYQRISLIYSSQFPVEWYLANTSLCCSASRWTTLLSWTWGQWAFRRRALKTSNDGGDTESVVWPKAPLHSSLDSFSIRPLDQHGQTNVHELHPFGYNPANCCHVIAESETHLKVRKVES